MIVISKSWQFQAAHSNPYHPDECSQIHGHTYTVRVWARGNVQANGAEKGMVCDTRRLSEAWNRLHKELDHSNLNESTTCDPTTVENLAKYILDYFRICFAYQPNVDIFKIRVYEGATTYAEVTI